MSSGTVEFSIDIPDNDCHMITVTHLDEAQWGEYRDLRLEALKNDPLAYGSSYEEELPYQEADWRRRTPNVLFAVEDGKPVGMIVCGRNNRIKTAHICGIYGVYITKDCRGRGIGNHLMDAALAEIRKMSGVVKIELAVNPTQKAAERLYRKYGFKVTGRVKKALRVDGKFYDELMMEKHL
jgi:ribosomal protein S18 acetylase RimI-like enzyme